MTAAYRGAWHLAPPLPPGCAARRRPRAARAATKVASLILSPPVGLAEDNRAALAQITARCAELKATRDLVSEFADKLCHRHGERLEAWPTRPRPARSASYAG